MTLTHGRTRKRYAESVALILFVIACGIALWALAIALAVLIIEVAF